MVRAGFFTEGDGGDMSLDATADRHRTAMDMSSRELDAMEMKQRAIAAALEGDEAARERTALILADSSLPPAMRESLQATLNYASPEVRADIMKRAGLSSIEAVDSDITGGGDVDTGVGFAEEAGTSTKRSRGYVKDDARKNSAFASSQHPMARPGTQGNVNGQTFQQVIRNNFEARDASRYDQYMDERGRLRPDAPAWVERQIASMGSPALAAARDAHQLPRLQELVLTPDHVGSLTDEQVAAIAGVSPDMVNDLVRQAVAGRRLTDQQIGTLKNSQRIALVGDVDPGSVSLDERSRSVDDNQRSSANRKLEYMLNMASDNRPQDFADLNTFAPWVWTQTGRYRPGSDSIVYPDAANSGDAISNWIRTTTGYQDGDLVGMLGDYMSKVMRIQASRPRGEGKALVFANSQAIPGERGRFYMRKYADDMPFAQHLLDTPVNREALPQPLNIGSDVTAEKPAGQPLDLSPLIDDAALQTPISTSDIAPSASPEEGDLGMADPYRRRLDPSFLASLLA